VSSLNDADSRILSRHVGTVGILSPVLLLFGRCPVGVVAHAGDDSRSGAGVISQKFVQIAAGFKSAKGYVVKGLIFEPVHGTIQETRRLRRIRTDLIALITLERKRIEVSDMRGS
jgi:hypothetical protein